MEPAFALASRLSRADRASYFEGVANALQWRERSDPEASRAWIAALPPRLATLANDIRDRARTCGLVDYGDGVDCRWPEVESCAR